MAKTTFTSSEIAYLGSRMLGRIATVDADGRPRLVPTGFRYNPETGSIDLGGYNLDLTHRYRDVQRNPYVAFVVDDLASTNPWRPRAVRVRGTVTVHGPDEANGHRGPAFAGAWMRPTPISITSMGLGPI
jgi:pyridoxamine 5'-phosphate oxidase family protein